MKRSGLPFFLLIMVAFIGFGLMAGCTVDDDDDDDDDDSGPSITCYRDADADGFGDPNDNRNVESDTCPDGWVTDNNDCNDDLAEGGADQYPGNDEACNGLDSDCDGAVDNGGDALCDDDAFCNGTETCAGASGCQAGTAPDCDDSVSCTDDSCDEGGDVCVNAVNDANCDDGAWCNGAETCDATLDCQTGTAPDCDDSVTCTDDSCDETGDACVNAVNDTHCDDGAWCNGVETCAGASGCQAGTAPDCDDSVSCTDDSCDEGGDVCVNAVNDANCDDGAWCNGAETCDATLDCQAGTAPDCDDSVSCTDDSCDEGGDVCVNTANDANCDDDLWCNGAETCDATLDCQDGTEPCTTYSECMEDDDLCEPMESPCLELDGSSDWAMISYDAAMDLQVFTAEAWFMVSSNPATKRHNYLLSRFHWDPSGDDDAGWQLRLSEVGGYYRLFCIIPDGSAAWPGITGPTYVSLDEWHHAAMVFDGTEIRLYLDGMIEGIKAYSGPVYYNTAALGVGRSPEELLHLLDGRIDEVRYSNIARYTDNFTPEFGFASSDANTILLLHLDEATGTTLYDESANNLDGSVNHTNLWSTRVVDD